MNTEMTLKQLIYMLNTDKELRSNYQSTIAQNFYAIFKIVEKEKGKDWAVNNIHLIAADAAENFLKNWCDQ